MFISEIKIMRRKNLGNYEHQEISITVSMTEDDNEAEALARGQKFVVQGLEGNVGGNLEHTPKPVNTPEKPFKKKAAKKAAKSKDKKEDPFAITTIEEVTTELRKTAEHFQDKKKAIAIIEEFGSSKLSEVKESDYAALVKRLQEVRNA